MRNKLFASAKGVINVSWCIAVLFLFVATAVNGTSLASSIPQISAGLQSSPWLTKGDPSACPEQFESISGIEPANAAKIQVQENYGKLPLYFIQNDGQMNEKVKYYEKGSGHAMFFTEKGVYLLLTSGREQDARNQKSEDINQKQDASRISVPLVIKGGSNGKTGKVAIKFKTQNETYKIRSSNSETPNSKLSTGNSQVTTTRLVKLTLLGANKCPEIVAEGLQECKVNYFIGNDRGKWQTNIPTYSAVVYKNIYDGIDLKFYGSNRQLEYDIIVKPGADPSKVRFTYEGIEDLQINNNGDLEIILSRLGEAVHTQQTHAVNSPLARGVECVSECTQKQSQESTFTNGDLKNDGFISPFAETQDRLNPSLYVIQKKPYVYQEIDGKKVEIGGRFEIQQAKGKKQESRNRYSKYLNPKSENQNRKSKISHPKFIYSFQVAAYDEHHPLVIDPTLVFSTYLGGSRSDSGYGIAMDTSGNAYVTGSTASIDFPTASAIYGSNTGEYYYNDSFIAKLNASGSNLEYSTYFGGNGTDFGWGIAVDTSSNAYVVGYTESSDFPTVNPVLENNAGYADAFVIKLNSAGSGLVYSTYLGGSEVDHGYGVAVDTAGNAYVTGKTGSKNFPIASAIYGSNSGDWDAFVTKLNASGSLTFSTYLGGNGGDVGYGITVDSYGNVYINGKTESTNFPTVSAIYGSYSGKSDAFVTKMNTLDSSLGYSTYLGGSGFDFGWGITIDISGNAYVTGGTSSSDFPTASAIYESLSESQDAFVTKLNTSGSLAFSTYLGGSGGYSVGYGISSDSGSVYVTGITNSSNFPTVNPIFENNAGEFDAFVAKLNVSGSELIYSTYLGGSSEDYAYGIAVDTLGNAYIVGYTESSNFPTTSAIYGRNAGESDAFVAKISSESSSDTTAPSGSLTINSGASYTNSTTVTVTLSVTDSTGVTGYYLSDSSSTPSASASGWTSVTLTTSYSVTISYSLSSVEGSKTVYVWFKDSSGNVSSLASDDITLDTTAPTINITSPTSDATYTATSSTISLGGSASDSTSGVKEVTWSSSSGGSGTASGTTSWTVSNISLSNGDNTITVTAKDNADNTATDTITVTYKSTSTNVPKVSTGSATNITETSATLNGTVNANGLTTTAWFNYGTNSGSYTHTSSTQTITGSGDTSVSISISGLSAGTKYYYRLAAQNSAGTSTGSDTSFTTKSLTTTPTPGVTPLPTLPPLPTPQVSPSPVKEGIVFGFVNDQDEQSLEGVTVTIKRVLLTAALNDISVSSDEFTDSTETDENGYYEFRGLEAGEYVIIYEKDGYKTQTQYVSLEEGELKDLRVVILEQIENGKIYGYAASIKGDPIEYVRLKLKGIKTKVSKSASSDADGFFEFTDLDADTYVIVSKKKGYRKTQQKVKLEEGESKEIEIVIREAKRIKESLLEEDVQ